MDEHTSKYTDKHVNKYTGKYVNKHTGKNTSVYVNEYTSKYKSKYTGKYVRPSFEYSFRICHPNRDNGCIFQRFFPKKSRT